MPLSFRRRGKAPAEKSKLISVHKFGGGVLKNKADYERTANLLDAEREKGDVVAVISALNGVTDRLIELIDEAAGHRDWTEIE